MRQFSIEAAVLCDEVRQEVNGKHILIGVYNGTIVVPDFPATLAVSWWMQLFPKEIGIFHLDIQILKDGKDTLVKAAIGYEVHAKDWASMVLPKIPMQVHGPGKLELQMKDQKDEEWSVVHSFEVRKGNVVSGMPPRKSKAD